MQHSTGGVTLQHLLKHITEIVQYDWGADAKRERYQERWWGLARPPSGNQGVPTADTSAASSE